MMSIASTVASTHRSRPAISPRLRGRSPGALSAGGRLPGTTRGQKTSGFRFGRPAGIPPSHDSHKGGGGPVASVRVLIGLVLAVAIPGVPVAYASHRLTSWRHFRIVEEGRLYRSGQLAPAVL